MIKNIRVSGMTGPVLYCDICGKRIEEALKANVLTVKRIEDGETSEVLHVHKGECDRIAEAKVGSNGWQDMQRHFLHLIYNTGLTLEHLQARKDSDNEIGGGFFSKIE